MIDSLSLLRCNELQLYMEHSFGLSGVRTTLRRFRRRKSWSWIRLPGAFYRTCSKFEQLRPSRTLAQTGGVPPPCGNSGTVVFCGERHPVSGRGAGEALHRPAVCGVPAGSPFLNVETVELGHGRSRELCEQYGTHRVYLKYSAGLTQWPPDMAARCSSGGISFSMNRSLFRRFRRA